MKDKTKTYVLLALVLGIWSIIAYRIFSTVNPKAPKFEIQNYEMAFHPKTTTTIDTFSVQTSERDPFLGTLYVKKQPTVAKTREKPKITWMPITYHGNISKQNTNDKVFVISINSRQHLMKLGQAVDSVKLIKGDKSHVTLLYRGNRKTIPKT